MDEETKRINKYLRATKMIVEMNDETLLNTWRAIVRGGFEGVSEVNDIPVGDWIEFVYSEVSTIRGLA